MLVCRLSDCVALLRVCQSAQRTAYRVLWQARIPTQPLISTSIVCYDWKSTRGICTVRRWGFCRYFEKFVQERPYFFWGVHNITCRPVLWNPVRFRESRKPRYNLCTASRCVSQLVSVVCCNSSVIVCVNIFETVTHEECQLFGSVIKPTLFSVTMLWRKSDMRLFTRL